MDGVNGASGGQGAGWGSPEALKRDLQGMADGLAEQIMGAVNGARKGQLINDSEEPVRVAGHEFIRAAFEAAIQQKIAAAEAASPPPEVTTIDPVTRKMIIKKRQNNSRQSRTVLTVVGRVKVVRRYWHATGQGSVVPADEVIDPGLASVSIGVR